MDNPKKTFFSLVDRQTFDLLYLERKERRDPPKFSDQLTDITVFEGATAKLRCEVKGKPTPKIEWLKNGEVKFFPYAMAEKKIININSSPLLSKHVFNKAMMMMLQH